MARMGLSWLRRMLVMTDVALACVHLVCMGLHCLDMPRLTLGLGLRHLTYSDLCHLALGHRSR